MRSWSETMHCLIFCRNPILNSAILEIAAKLKDSGILLATIRDYDHLLSDPAYDAGAGVL